LLQFRGLGLLWARVNIVSIIIPVFEESLADVM